MNPAVANVFATYPLAIREKVLAMRALILETAAGTEGVGQLEETLKWGEPAYLTSESRSGTTVRLAWHPSAAESYALYFNCQTSLVDTFRSWFPDELTYEGNRAIVFAVGETVPRELVKECIVAALTYHRRSRRRRPARGARK